jgi:hypothetical protein
MTCSVKVSGQAERRASTEHWSTTTTGVQFTGQGVGGVIRANSLVVARPVHSFIYGRTGLSVEQINNSTGAG